MCIRCDEIAKRFPLDLSSHHAAFADYKWAYKALTDKVSLRHFELYAGDCPMDEIEHNLDIMYTMRHYVRCRNCGRIFFIGFCVRGMPLGEIVDSLPPTIEHISNGHYGTYYDKE